MAKTFKYLSETIIVPAGCHEQFFPLNHDALADLRDLRMIMGGVSRVLEPYEICRPAPTFHVLLYTLHGSGTILEGKKETIVRKGDLAVISSGHRQHYRARKSWHILWFHLLPFPRWSMLEETPFHCRPARELKSLWAAAEGIFRETSQTQSFQMDLLQMYARTICLCLEREFEVRREDVVTTNHPALTAMLNTVSDGISEKWTVARMAQMAHMSEAQLHRLMHRYCGGTPMEWLNTLRMQRAVELLCNTSYKVGHVAAIVGYSTPFAFSRAFKRATGLTPTNASRGLKPPHDTR